MSGDGFVVERGESFDERRVEEVRVGGEEGVKEMRLREGLGELGECVGDVESWGERVGDEVGEAEETD